MRCFIPSRESPLSDPLFIADPYPFYAQVRAESPAFKTRLPKGPEVYLVTRYADVLEGLKDNRLVKNIHHARQARLLDTINPANRASNTNMLRADPPEHTRLRALAHEAFTPRFVSQMREHIQTIADQLIDSVAPEGEMDLIDRYAFPLPITVICEMLGVPVEDDRKFRQWSTAFIDSGALSQESIPVTQEMIQISTYLRHLIDQHRKTPEDDLISRLINANMDGDHYNQTELVSTCTLLLIAGHETTVNLIGNGMLALLTHPDQLEKLKAKSDLVKPAVEEILRFVNPVQMVNRFASADLEIGGVAIPKGSHVMMVVAAGNHDPTYTSEPEDLDVTRSDARHLAFGQGIHYCLGAPLARLEGEIAIGTLLRRLPALRLAVDPQELKWRSGLNLRGLRSLPVKF